MTRDPIFNALKVDLGRVIGRIDSMAEVPLGDLRKQLDRAAEELQRIAWCVEQIERETPAPVRCRNVTRELRLTDENRRLRAEVADLKAQHHVEAV